RWDRVILESDLARPPALGWCWCAPSIADAGFVRTDGGASIAVGAAGDADLPPELALALNAAAAHAPRAVRVDVGGIGPERLAPARARTGIEFRPGVPWRWFDADAAAFASAIDLQAARDDAGRQSARSGFRRLFVPALSIAALALVIHVTATVGQWLWLQWQVRAVQRELASIAHIAAPDAPADAPPLQAIARRDAELRHRAGLAARDDVLPLLARAAPALAAFPAGTTRSLRYADGHVVFELQELDPARLERVQHDLQDRGLTAIAAPTSTGARLRLGLD
ncbi:MAG: GspL/Epsl periplasmic domain-containing protein, partial [Casimicrobiaceae bacterium]